VASRATRSSPFTTGDAGLNAQTRQGEFWQRALPLLSGLWLGVLLCLALVATPSAFAVLSTADAGRFASRVLNLEGRLSLVMAAIILWLERQRQRRWVDDEDEPPKRLWTPVLVGALLAVLFNVLAQEVVQPILAQVRQDPASSRLSFGQLHAISVILYGLKILAVAALAWQATRPVSSVRSVRS